LSGAASRRDRRIVTDTSSNVSGIGADGLCTVTSTACSRVSCMAVSAMRPASVSMRSHGSPPTSAAAISASSP
jgi:hypothetical protein